MKSELKSINPVGIVRRIITMFMDACLFLLAFALLAGWIFAPIADDAFDYSKKGAEGLEYQVYSKLYVYVERVNDETLNIIENTEDLNKERVGTTDTVILDNYNFENIDDYKNRLQYYYCNYLQNEGLVFNHGAPSKVDVITIEDFTGSPVEYYETKVAPLTDKDSVIQECLKAENHFYFSDYIVEINNELKAIQLFIILPPFALSFGVFYILVPLLFKNGETLCKKWNHIAIVTKDGYTVKKRQIVFRQLIIFTYITLSLFIVGVGITSLATLGVGVFIYFLICFINKDKRSFADLAAYTLVIDSSNSVWFDTPEIEKEKENEINKNVAEMKKNKVENKNLIQVGTTIIEEEYNKVVEK